MSTEVVRGVGGAALACYEEESREGVRWADDLRLVEAASPVDAADRIVVELSGWGATTQAVLGAHLVERGAGVRREFDTFTHGLQGFSPPLAPTLLPSNLAVRPAEAVDPAELRETYAAAYPVGHPDHHDMSKFEDLLALMAGTLMGPLLPTSAVLIDTDRGVGVAAVLAHDCPGIPPEEGPWISEVFRDPAPAYRGIGSLLLRHVLEASAEAGIPALGLAVTAGNPAARVYADIGFVRTARWVDLVLP
ncbi:N-acetyltransferase family protein [Nocardia sp. CA-128927]|uniref:GNAT family N-acetyltransferase n=1 Tax=Nocardia sp. CA-128927 TaxID=3239975 RepID=UPI003D959406